MKRKTAPKKTSKGGTPRQHWVEVHADPSPDPIEALAVCDAAVRVVRAIGTPEVVGSGDFVLRVRTVELAGLVLTLVEGDARELDIIQIRPLDTKGNRRWCDAVLTAEVDGVDGYVGMFVDGPWRHRFLSAPAVQVCARAPYAFARCAR